MISVLRGWVPRATPVSVKERFRSAIGAALGIVGTGLVCRFAIGPGGALPILIAPMGASAVLLFAVPASPLAQPWSILGGNLIAAIVGVSAARLVADPFLAAGLAIAVAIGLMMSCRCVHPPSGAVALTAVLGGHAIGTLGYGFVLWPVGANSVLLLGVALMFNRMAGRSYPNRSGGAAVESPAGPDADAPRMGFTSADLDAVLSEYDRLLEVDRADLEAILRQAELRAYGRRMGTTTCASIMVRNVIAVGPDAPIREAVDLLRVHRIKALPVTDDHAEVIGIVTQTDLLEKAMWAAREPRLALRHRWHLTLTRGRAPNASIADIMTVPVTTLSAETTLAEAVRLMARTGLHHLPVVGADRKLIGMLAQSDLIVALLAEASAATSNAETEPPGTGPGGEAE